jgi:hypothetical protein
MEESVMDILEAVAIELPCKACGSPYKVTLKQVLLSREMLHEGCPVSIEFTTECPALYYADLIDYELIHGLERTWHGLEESAHAAGGKLVLRELHSKA